MKISVVISAYNEEKYIRKTLESVKRLNTTGYDVKVLVVDGGSTDKTAEIAKSFGARVIKEPHKSIGFARQEGLKESHGDIVVFTDADTLVPSDWLIRHVSELSKPQVVCTFGGYRYYDGSFPLYQIFNYIQPISIYLLYKLFNLPIASGQNIACWRKKAMEIGGFDQNLKIMEDTDFTIRMKKAGRVVYLPNLLIYSSGRRSKEGLGFFWRILKAQLKYFIFNKRNLERFPDYR